MADQPVWSAVAALAAAALFAVAAVAQHRAAAAVPEDRPLVGSLVRNRRWLAGIGADAGGYGLQVVALALGPVLIVQPLLVTALVFALPLAARIDGRRVSGRTWLRALLLVLALATFLLVGQPSSGEPTAPLRHWLLPLGVLLGVVALAVLGASVRPRAASPGATSADLRVATDCWPTTATVGTTAPATTAQPPGAPGTRADSRRALLFGAAGGALFGLAAALTDFVAGRFGDGLAAVLGSWQTWALVAAGLLGVYLQQRAFQVGSLAAALPAATVAEPLAAAFLGLTVLDERLRADGFALVVVVVAVLVLAVAAVALARAEAAD